MRWTSWNGKSWKRPKWNKHLMITKRQVNTCTPPLRHLSQYTKPIPEADQQQFSLHWNTKRMTVNNYKISATKGKNKARCPNGFSWRISTLQTPTSPCHLTNTCIVTAVVLADSQDVLHIVFYLLLTGQHSFGCYFPVLPKRDSIRVSAHQQWIHIEDAHKLMTCSLAFIAKTDDVLKFVENRTLKKQNKKKRYCDPGIKEPVKWSTDGDFQFMGRRRKKTIPNSSDPCHKTRTTLSVTVAVLYMCAPCCTLFINTFAIGGETSKSKCDVTRLVNPFSPVGRLDGVWCHILTHFRRLRQKVSL